MKKSLLYRAHEWLADNCKWVQYPNVRAYNHPLFRHQMHWTSRVMLVIAGVSVLVFSAVLAVPLIAILYGLLFH